MSDSSRHNISAVLETDYGVTPASPVMSRIRHTGTNIGLSKNTFISEELRADRQISDFRHGARQIGGDIVTELSYASFDAFLEAVLCGTWAVGATKTAATISAAASDSSVNDSGNGFVTAGFKVADIITISGFTGTPANNKRAKIASVAAGKLILTDLLGVALVLVDDAAGESVTIVTTGNRLKAGVVRRSFSVLREFSDIAGADLPFLLYNGVEFSKLALNVTVDAIIKATFSVVGRNQEDPTETAPGSTTYVAQNTNPSMDSFGGALLEGGVTNAVITEIQLTLDNGITPRFVVGSDKTIVPSIGRSNLSGQITAYFENSELVQKFISGTESSIQFTLADGLGNDFIFTLPRVKYNGGQPDTQGQGPITLTMPFQALLDSATGSQVVIDRIPHV